MNVTRIQFSCRNRTSHVLGSLLSQEHFDPEAPPDAASSLAIALGRGGARLSHSHQKQYIYVSQSLTLCARPPPLPPALRPLTFSLNACAALAAGSLSTELCRQPRFVLWTASRA